MRERDLAQAFQEGELACLDDRRGRMETEIDG